jgi:hypothetical protein
MTRYGGNARAMASTHLVSGPTPLLYGLLGGFGQPLLTFADAAELSTPLLFVQAMVLAAIDWSDSLYALLSGPIPDIDVGANSPHLPPLAILSHIATDGRLAGIMRGSIGYQEVQRILANPTSQAAVVEHILSLDADNTSRTLDQLADLSVLLLCGSHRPGKPAFDFYFSQLPAFIHALAIVLPEIEDEGDRRVLLRGVWALFVLAYITQLRPILDDKLISAYKRPAHFTWVDLLSEFHVGTKMPEGKYLDSQFLRALRSMRELAQRYPAKSDFLLRAAYKLRDEWKCWTGLGHDGAGSLNIRL